MLRLNHELRNVQVFAGKHHCISFSADGKYNLYEFDDNGHWKTTVTVNCSHWQTGGLVAGMIDTTARNILTLSRRGNFMCTSFKYILPFELHKFKYNVFMWISVKIVITQDDTIKSKHQKL